MLPSKVFEFLKLPAEIRNMVYWNALVKRYKCRSFRQPPLTLVNKQIRSESLPILYGNGTFYIKSKQRVHPFQKFRTFWPIPRGISNVEKITKLDIQFSVRTQGLSSGVKIDIHMRNNELEGGHLLGKQLVGKPGLEWKNRDSIEGIYDRFLMEEIRARAGLRWVWEEWVTVFRAASLVAEALLYFAKKCPAAAKWVWLAMEVLPRVV